MIIGKNQFFEIQKKYFRNIPFNQTQEWFESTSCNDSEHYFVNNVERPEIACWGRVFKRKFIGNHLIIDGVAIQTDNIKIICDFFNNIVIHGYSIIEISDISIYSVNYEIGIRQAGFIRPILSLSPLSLYVNVQEPFCFKRNWKRNVKKAFDTKCSFEIIEMPSENHLKEFVQLFNQLKIRKGLGYSIKEKSLSTLLESKNYKLFFVKNKDGKYLSGRIVYVHNEKAYDVFAANSNEGITSGAAYFIQENILKYLKDLRISEFDYGRISPSNDEMNNIYISKNYSGGNPILYNGQWFYSKNKKIGMIYEFYKFIIKNQRRY